MSYLDSFRSSSPVRQLLTVGLAAAALGAVLIVAYFLLVRRPYEVLYSNLRATDAATVVSALDTKKIPYRLADGGATILVPSNLVDNVRLSMTSENLPIKGVVGFELFNKSDMGLTEFAQRINYQRALQGELARTIMTMDSVDTARVQLTLTEPTIFRDDRRPSKASVTIIPRLGKQLSAGTVHGIQRLVAASVPDLAVEDVVVLGADGSPVSGESLAVDSASPQGDEKRAVEAYYASKLRQALSAIFPGGTQVDVAARTEPSSTSIDGHAAALDSWSPNARAFPLTVAISFPTTPSAQVQDEVRRLATQAIGLDSAKGDALTMAMSSASPNVIAASSASDGVPAELASKPLGTAPQARVSQASVFWLIRLIPLLLLLGLAALFIHRRGREPRKLTQEQRSQVARRLQTLLEREEPDVAQPV